MKMARLDFKAVYHVVVYTVLLALVLF